MRNLPNSYSLISQLTGIIILLFSFSSCVYEEFEQEEVPTASQTNKLQAFFVRTAPDKINSSYWASANFVRIEVKNISINNLNNEDGFLNMNGMYSGLEDFRSDTIELILKAAYDNQNIYILASWYDERFDASYGNWLFNGPADDRKTGVSPDGWSSQRNDDN